MARQITDIQAEIIAAKNNDTTLAALNSTSKVAIWYLWTFVVATCIWTLEKLFDLHVAAVDAKLASLKPHRLRWYQEKAKSFQFGYAPVQDEDYYDNSLLTAQQVVDSQVIKFSAATKVANGIRIKVSTVDNSGELIPVPEPEYSAFIAFMETIKDEGVRLFFVNEVADSLKIHLKIYYNPLILDANGARLDGSALAPVEDALYDFLKTGVEYNGLFIPAKLTDKLQAVTGVIIPHIELAQKKYAALDFSDIGIEYNPFSGYLRINDPADLTIEYIAHAIL